MTHSGRGFCGRDERPVQALQMTFRHTPPTVIIVHPVIAGFSGRAMAYPTEDALADQARETAQEQVDKTLARLGGPGPETVTVQGSAASRRRFSSPRAGTPT
jgi:hypothetical protein